MTPAKKRTPEGKAGVARFGYSTRILVINFYSIINCLSSAIYDTPHALVCFAGAAMPPWLSAQLDALPVCAPGRDSQAKGSPSWVLS